jgi:CDGSH-type Zn-finger protein
LIAVARMKITVAKIKFDGTETASRKPFLEQADLMDGPVYALADAQGLCAFGPFCDPNGQDWDQVGQSGHPRIAKNFLRQVHDCPAGRLVALDKQTGAPLEPALEKTVGLIEGPVQECSGPLWVGGGVPITSADGHDYEVRNRVTLCRCGKSTQKPFCNGAHAGGQKFVDGP